MQKFLTFSALLLAGCAATPSPPFTAAHPASPEAPEGARLARRTSLREDEATRKTHALLSAAQREQERWDQFGPVSGPPEDARKAGSQPETHHDH